VASPSWVQITAGLLPVQARTLPLLPSSERSGGGGMRSPALLPGRTGGASTLRPGLRGAELAGAGSLAAFQAALAGLQGARLRPAGHPLGECQPRLLAGPAGLLRRRGWRGAAAHFACPAASGHKGHKKASTPGPENRRVGLAVQEAAAGGHSGRCLGLHRGGGGSS